MDDLRYPIGRFEPPAALDDPVMPAAARVPWIEAIGALPGQLRAAVADLTDEQLDTQYRPEGWTLRQVVHHLPDSHLNAIVRFKWALTEETPSIKPYNEQAWARLPDVARTPIGVSLDLLAALHARWTALLRSLGDADFARTLDHPEVGRQRLDLLLSHYAWHGRHHLAHISHTRDRHGW